MKISFFPTVFFCWSERWMCKSSLSWKKSLCNIVYECLLALVCYMYKLNKLKIIYQSTVPARCTRLTNYCNKLTN